MVVQFGRAVRAVRAVRTKLGMVPCPPLGGVARAPFLSAEALRNVKSVTAGAPMT
ncbi:hypothetical protein BH23DEI1_BH23DEI1_23950 [soil metagenome]